MHKIILYILVGSFFSSCASQNLVEHGFVKINPPFNKTYVCAEHAVEKMGVGDVYGRDCMINKFIEDKGKKWNRLYQNDGSKNEHWHSWNQDVLAPFNGTVTQVHINEKTNKPGHPNKSRASALFVKSDSGIMLLIAHIQNPQVKKGDRISKGQVIAKVGNNGYAWMPHIHIGAWKDKKPLQIVFDMNEWQKTVEKLYPEFYKKQ